MVAPSEALRVEWCRLLDVSDAAEDQNFFDMGGDSLLAIELFSAVADASGWELPVELLFAEGTYGSLFGASQRAGEQEGT